ncbi:uncharacterized protein Tco025E_05372 [Trypanosoma conorhini]|uniref:Uncharacterized protein n=1 Tax=Trypanosoma conorhini TaxID=83891 RepID=A0A3R7MJN8_9TRYP|nr:uncharacterized protein Tco025E_05372 [Trypanosoma conorhini]RNF16251.1 hypothetical protein Tco025E_05372 [Trypanosoma conorhini]
MGAIDAVRRGFSPPWVDAVVSIAPVELLETRELALLAVHPDGSVTAWSPQDPSVLLMRKRPMDVSCVATTYETVQHSSLAWFGASTTVQCCRARCGEGRHVHLQLLYHLRLDVVSGIRELHTDGASLVAVINCDSPEVIFWPAIGHVVNAHNIEEQAERCVFRRIFGSQATFVGTVLGDASSLLLTEDTVWIGCTSGALVLVDGKDTELDGNPLFNLRTAGACSVTALALLSHPLHNSVVASGLENGDIILWSARDGAQLGQYFVHAGAICSMAYLPWCVGLCTVSATREVFFWGWQETPGFLLLVECGVLGDDMGSSAPRCLCPLRDTELLACGGEASHILRWKPQEKPDAVAELLSTLPPVLTGRPQLPPGELPHLRAEPRSRRESATADETDLRNTHHNALVTRMGAYGPPRKGGEAEVEVSHQGTQTSASVQLPADAVESSYLVADLKLQLRAAQQQRDQLLEKLSELEKAGQRPKELSEAESTSSGEENAALASCTARLGSKLDEEGRHRPPQRALRADKMVGTSDNPSGRQVFLYAVPQSDRGTQAPSCGMSPCMGETKQQQRREENGKEMTLPVMSCCSLRQSPPRCFLETPEEFSSGTVRLRNAPTDEPTQQSALANALASNHYGTSHPLSAVPSQLLQEEKEGTGLACIVEALQVQLSLMEVLLRNYREASAATDSLQFYSTNILSDVYLMTRDILGAEAGSAIVQEALEGMPLSNEIEVIRKLFLILCHRCRATLTQLPPRSK